MSEINKTYNIYKKHIDDWLEATLTDKNDGADKLREVMRYAVLNGGKRLRPVLTVEFSRLCGGNPNLALPVAGGVEMLHCYSLIHDDLPCMDNDDERRGQPSCHKKFNETLALLAGDALQAEAFNSVCSLPSGDGLRARCLDILAKAAGVAGICGGQYLDLSAEDADRDYLLKTDSMKTAALFSAACAIGVASANGEYELEEAAAAFGRAYGMAFQIRDDIADKNGLYEVLGERRCRNMIMDYCEEALGCLKKFKSTDLLQKLVDQLVAEDA